MGYCQIPICSRELFHSKLLLHPNHAPWESYSKFVTQVQRYCVYGQFYRLQHTFTIHPSKVKAAVFELKFMAKFHVPKVPHMPDARWLQQLSASFPLKQPN